VNKVTAYISKVDIVREENVVSDGVTLELTLNLSREGVSKIVRFLTSSGKIEFLIPDSVDFRDSISVVVNDNGLILEGGQNV